ncbi:MAG: hypothetical protein FJ265_05655, partial [Planctomycetes bacterium]|nr:hypothetical protein [Planctomycetota bacterium]
MDPRMRWLSLLAFLCSLLVPAAAQDAGRLTLAASFEPAAAKPGDEVVLVLVAAVQEGYHAYGTKEPTNLPVALDPAKVKTNGLELVGAAKIPPGLRKSVLGMESYPLPNVFTVRQTLKVPAGANAGEVEVSGEFDYQVCDENSCEPQTTAPFRAKLVVEAGAAPVPPPEPVAEEAGRLTLAASFEPAAAKPGDEVVLVLVATVQEGYHAYGTKEPTNLPVALDPAKVKTNGLELVGPAKIPPGLRKDTLGMESYPLPNVFTVRQTLKVPAGAVAGEVEVSGEFDYQVCDENSCEPQTTAPFRAKLVVEAGAGGGRVEAGGTRPEK